MSKLPGMDGKVTHLHPLSAGTSFPFSRLVSFLRHINLIFIASINFGSNESGLTFGWSPRLDLSTRPIFVFSDQTFSRKFLNGTTDLCNIFDKIALQN